MAACRLSAKNTTSQCNIVEHHSMFKTTSTPEMILLLFNYLPQKQHPLQPQPSATQAIMYFSSIAPTTCGCRAANSTQSRTAPMLPLPRCAWLLIDQILANCGSPTCSTEELTPSTIDTCSMKASKRYRKSFRRRVASTPPRTVPVACLSNHEVKAPSRRAIEHLMAT